MKTIEGGIEKVFVMINSANYNNDGKYCIHIGNLAEMAELGMNTSEDVLALDNLDVDETALTDYKGCYVIRIA